MSRVVLLTFVCVLCLIAVVVQAASYPLMVKNGTTTIFDDNFEGVGVGAAPLATTGSWSWDQDYGAVDYPNTLAVSDTAAYEGSKSLKLDGSDPYGSCFVTAVATGTAAGDTVTLKYAFRNTPGNDLYTMLRDDTGDAMFAIATVETQVQYTTTNGYSAVAPIGTATLNAWNTLTVTHTNGVDGWALSLNGGTPSILPGFNEYNYLNNWNEVYFQGQFGVSYIDAVPVVPTYLPGDADKNGTVNGADLNIVLSNYNKTSGMSWTTGDFDGNGTVNGADLNVVLSNYNKVAGVSAAVPEPSTLLLAGAGVAGLLAFGWRRKK